MIKYQEILRRLLEEDGGRFQNICDAVLSATEEDCNIIFKPGAQTLTTKTRPGTPDTYFVLPNNQYVLIEYTTESASNASNVVKKFKRDIDKCTDREKTGIDVDEISKIICCCTADFSLEDHKALVSYGEEKGVKIDLRGIHFLARYLSGSCANIAKEYLGIPIDTHQILSPEIFAQEYEASGLATPLSNTFLHRQNEVTELLESIQSKGKVTILTGPPGMGKSRLAMEAFEQVLERRPETLCFCITNKNAYLHDDLRTYLSKKSPYLFLVDDANRQTGHLESLLAVLKEARSADIHVVITVRDYALAEVEKKCKDFDYQIIKVGRFSDGELSDILRSKDFQVNGKGLKRILEISKGNPRLAIMAAKVYKESNDLSALDDVATLYDRYFEAAVGDSNIFSDPDLLRSLGLLSFFFSIDLENKDFISNISNRFGIEQSKFRSALIELEKLELAESNDDLTIVKIGDQVLGTYFFYRTFLRDNLLPFRTVMEYYRTSHLGRIRDSIIPANNTFSYEKVYPKVDHILSEFWGMIMQDELQAFAFLSLFWQYRKTDLFAFVRYKIEQSPKAVDNAITFSSIPSSERLGYGRDQYLALLNNFFSDAGRDAQIALLLSLQYIKAYPPIYSQLLENLRSEFAVTTDDKLSNYARQWMLWNNITNGFNKSDDLARSLFKDLFAGIMQTGYKGLHSTKIHFDELGEQYPESLISYMKLRNLSWETLDRNFDLHSEDMKGILLAFIQANTHVPYNIYHFDFESLYPLFTQRLDPGSFVDCYIVREFTRVILKEKIEDKRIKELKDLFNCQTYQYFIVLSSDRLRDKEMFDYEFTDSEKYRRLKDTEIRNKFQISSLDEFKDFYGKVLEIYAFKATYTSGILYSVNILLLDIFERDPLLLLSILNYLIDQKNTTQLIPYHVFGRVWSDLNTADSVFELISSRHFESRTSWQQIFLERVPEDLVNIAHTKAYIELMKTTQTEMNVSFHALLNLSQMDSQLYNKAISILSKRNSDKLVLDDTVFSEHLDHFDYIDEVGKVYLQQDRLQKHFDYQYKGLIAIVSRDETFLMKYIKSLSLNYDGLSRSDYHDLHHIWELQNAEKHIWDIMDYISKQKSYLIAEDALGIFFSGLEPQFSERGRALAIAYLKANDKDITKVNLILDVLRNIFPDIEPQGLLLWLDQNPSFEDFKRLHLQNSLLSGGGGTVFNELRANRMKKVLGIFNLLPVDDFRFLEHKLYLEEKISIYSRAAINERRQNFLYGE